MGEFIKKNLAGWFCTGIGMTFLWLVGTMLDVRQAVAIHDTQIIEVEELNDKMDEVARRSLETSTSMSHMRGDIAEIKDDLDKLESHPSNQ